MKFFKVKQYNKLLIPALLLCASPGYAAGLEKVNEGLENIRTGLLAVSVIVITLAIIWAGYKLLVAHAQVMEIARIFCGAMLIGGASGIAGWFV
jgi:type IV secretion system protein VirB2